LIRADFHVEHLRAFDHFHVIHRLARVLLDFGLGGRAAHMLLGGGDGLAQADLGVGDDARVVAPVIRGESADPGCGRSECERGDEDGLANFHDEAP
jgi:hypothetical protein